MFEDESSNDLQEEDTCCDECGMAEGHSLDCSSKNLGEDDAMPSPGNKDSKNMTKKLRSFYTKFDGKTPKEEVCPECNAPAGKPHAQDCMLDEIDSINETDSNSLGSDECPECGNRDNLYVEKNGSCYCEECDSSWNVDTERPSLDHEDTMTSRSEDGEYHEDSDFDDGEYSDDVEVCPGCGVRVGSGINDECDDPMGCGYWKDFGGQANLDPKQPEAFTKRQNWNENCDYDGLALNESSMFNRFDTLVGQRRDGSFDYRVNENMKLRALVKKVVSEIKEMKLSVSGPAFGSMPSDNNDYQDDDVSKVSKSKKSKTKPKSKSKS